MIVFRYLAKEVLLTMVAVSGVLLLIIMSGRFIKYLSQAASGKLAPDVLFSIIAYRMPEFLQQVLPLGLFLGILLAFGRLYMDSEMTVLTACGVTRRRLVAYTLLPALAVAVFVAWLSLFVGPLGLQRAELILNEQKGRSEFDNLHPQRFQPLQGGAAITYTEKLSADRQRMNGVFLAEMAQRQGNDQSDTMLAVIVAQQGSQMTDKNTGQRYLVLHDGYRYEGDPGKPNYRVTRFKSYAQRLPEPEILDHRKLKRDTMPSSQLLQSEDPGDIAALQWRISLPLLVIVIALMAVPLSRTSPRQGRFVKMLPSILLYILYLILLNATRGWVEDGRIPVQIGLWWVHGVFFVLALILLSSEQLGHKFRAMKKQPERRSRRA